VHRKYHKQLGDTYSKVPTALIVEVLIDGYLNAIPSVLHPPSPLTEVFSTLLGSMEENEHPLLWLRQGKGLQRPYKIFLGNLGLLKKFLDDMHTHTNHDCCLY